MKEKTGDIKTAYEMDYADTEKVQCHYADWAKTYDADTDGYGYVGPAEAAAALAEHLETQDSRVLDLGCGTGLVGAALVDLGFANVDGSDLSPEMIEVCQSKGFYRSLRCDDLLAGLGVPDKSYDAVICVGTFGPIGPKALPSALAPVKAGGLACISVNEIFLAEHDFQTAFADLVTTGAWRLEWSGLRPHLTEGGHDALVTVLRRT